MAAFLVQALDALGPGGRAAVHALVAEADAAAGFEVLGEVALDELAHDAAADQDWVAARDGRLEGYAHLAPRPGSWQLETAFAPGVGTAELRRALVETALERVGAAGGGTVHYWVRGADDVDDAETWGLGFAAGRDLLEMTVPLPLGPEARRATSSAPDATLALRPFRPGLDEAAWLALNNRAFADHPEQGGWDLETLARREAAPWFDPEGFLVLDAGDWAGLAPAPGGTAVMAGACWTKLHHATRPRRGEIFVIAVDPALQGLGLGRLLTVAGFDWLARHGAELGMLYVDAANHGAVSLYRALGMRVERVDRAYVREVALGA